MPAQFDGHTIGAMQYQGVKIREAMLDGHVWRADSRPVVQIDDTSYWGARDQFRQACLDYGTSHQDVEELPFRLDVTRVTNLRGLFSGCSSLVEGPELDISHVYDTDRMFLSCVSLVRVPDLKTAQVANMYRMFYECSSLTDGNVRLIGRHPDADISGMIFDSGLTREPFYDQQGNPI